MSDITKQSLSELIKNIKHKKLSSTEVTKAFVERSEKSKELNAYVTEDFSAAIDKAKKFDENPNLDLKLPGIPMAVKDLFCTKNVKTTAGSKILNNFRFYYNLHLLNLEQSLGNFTTKSIARKKITTGKKLAKRKKTKNKRHCTQLCLKRFPYTSFFPFPSSTRPHPVKM